MASYLNPQPSNAILDDIINIRELENYNAQSDPSLGSDFPVGAKRFINIGTATAPQWQWQRYDGTSWQVMANTATEKLMHNVDMLDGYHASTSAVANSIPVYNADKLLVGGITGNAATATKLKTARNLQVGGIASGDAKSFNGTAAVTLPINSINVNNAEDDAIVGVLTATHGGTGRTDGAAQDVRVNSLAGEVSAKAYGQIGRAKPLGSTHLDTVVVDGFYVGGINSAYHSEEYGYPQTNSSSTFLRVISTDKFILQILETNAELWRRASTNSGASWYGWLPVGGTHGAGINLYVSKSGSDSNSGLSAENPLLTIGKAIRIASGMTSGVVNAAVKLMLGEGDWGNVTFRDLPFWLDIIPYDGSTPTAYSESLPKFGELIIRGMNAGVYGLVANTLIVQWNAYVSLLAGYKRVGSISVTGGSFLSFNSQNATTNVLEITDAGTAGYVLNCYAGGRVDAEYLHIKLAANVSRTAFFACAAGSIIRVVKGRTVIDASSYTFTGKKCRIESGAMANDGGAVGTANFFTESLPGEGADVYDGALLNGGASHDSRVVHTTGNETISGTKTFTTLNKFRYGINDLTTTPASTEYLAPFVTYDKTGRYCSAIETAHYSSGEIFHKFQIRKATNGDTVSYVAMGIREKVDGTVQGEAPSTPSNSTGNEIVTANWLYNRGLGEQMPYQRNTDPDTLRTSGVYWISNEEGKLPSGTNGCIIVEAIDTGVVRQIFFRHGTIDTNDHNIYTRQLYGTTIGEWVRIMTSKGGTFNSSLFVSGASTTAYNIVNTGFARGDALSTTQYHQINLLDKTGINSTPTRFANVEFAVLSTQIAAYLRAYKNVAGGSVSAQISVVYPNEGDPYATAPAPVATSNTNHIATTAWVRARSKWTYKSAVLHNAATAVGEYQLDFSSYLPADGEEYEVLLSVYGSANSDTTTNSVFNLFTPGNTLCMVVEAEGKNFEQANGSMVFPVSSTRVVKYTVSGTSFDEKLTIRVAGYRKA